MKYFWQRNDYHLQLSLLLTKSWNCETYTVIVIRGIEDELLLEVKEAPRFLFLTHVSKTLHCPGLVLDLVVDLGPALDLAPEQPEPDCTSLYTVYVLTSTHVYLVIWPRSF